LSGLEVSEVTVRFGGRLALDDVSLAASPGHVTGLIGPNGAGKTTLFNVVCGLVPPERGHVVIDGREVTRTAPFKRARAGLARTFQRLEPFGLLTVRENVQLAADVARRADPAAVAAELLGRLGLTDVGDVRADRLPTGSARMVELARALATDPSVVLLDEPASGQDDGETARFAEVIRGVAAEGVAVVLVEHDVRLVMQVCDRVHVLDLGAIIAAGSPVEIQRDARVLEAYLGSKAAS
jgi:branched-chain amino acid transport system ATP-binding protein